MNRRFIRWLSETISCEAFARHVAQGIAPPPGGVKGRLYFWLHWVWCPYCRTYWDEIHKLGAVQRARTELRRHPAVKMDDIKNRIRKKLGERFA